jgi:hypothetical protein
MVEGNATAFSLEAVSCSSSSKRLCLFQIRSLAALEDLNEGSTLITNSLSMMRATGAMLLKGSRPFVGLGRRAMPFCEPSVRFRAGMIAN